MTNKLQLKNLVLSLVLALAMVAGALPGVMQTGHAAGVEEVWTTDQTIESDKTIERGLGIGADITVTINEGATLTVNNSIYADEGTTLTVSGKGALVVTGHNGSNGTDIGLNDQGDGGVGGSGRTAINANIIVDGASVTVTGGNGGKGGNSYPANGGNGGDGGNGVGGNVTVNSGSITVTAGSGGNGGDSYSQKPGNGGNGGKSVRDAITVNGGEAVLLGGNGGVGGTDAGGLNKGQNGTFGKAVVGEITGKTAEESEDNNSWTAISGSTSEKQYVKVSTPTAPPVTVKIDVGAGHAALFTSDVLTKIKDDFSLDDVTISGNVITLKGVDPQKTEGEMQFAIWNVIDDLTDLDGIDNGDYFLYVGYKPIDDYATEEEYEDDVYGDKHYETPISDGMTFYALWQKPYTKLEIDNGNPKCGMISWKAMPSVPEGLKLDPENSYWKEGEGEFVESFKGGNEYTFNGQIYVYNWSGDYWKYYFNPDNFTMTVKDAKDFEYNFDGHGWIKFSYKATANHDWDEGTVTKEPTETADGVKTFKCKHCDATKTEAIPKLAPKDKPAAPKIKTTAPKIKTTAKTSARAMTVKWTMKWGKVKGAKSYKVAYRRVGSKKWTYKTTKKTKYVVKGHKLKGLYEYKVAAISKKGAAWSSTSRRYFSSVSDKAKAGKGSIKLSWKKDKTATGYQVFVATNKNMKNSKKFEVGKSAKSYKIKGLKKGKRYYVRVRPMKTHGGVTYKGILSKTIKVRVK